MIQWLRPCSGKSMEDCGCCINESEPVLMVIAVVYCLPVFDAGQDGKCPIIL